MNIIQEMEAEGNRKEGASFIKVAKVLLMPLGQRAGNGVEKQKQFLANKC